MAQEALNNAIKHSKATNIEVQLEYNDSYFRLAIDDDGIGFNPALLESAKTGIGLKSMQNRAALIGGILSVVSGIVTGAIITIKLNGSKMLV